MPPSKPSPSVGGRKTMKGKRQAGSSAHKRPAPHISANQTEQQGSKRKRASPADGVSDPPASQPKRRRTAAADDTPDNIPIDPELQEEDSRILEGRRAGKGVTSKSKGGSGTLSRAHLQKQAEQAAIRQRNQEMLEAERREAEALEREGGDEEEDRLTVPRLSSPSTWNEEEGGGNEDEGGPASELDEGREGMDSEVDEGRGDREGAPAAVVSDDNEMEVTSDDAGRGTPAPSSKVANLSKELIRERIALVDAFPKDRDNFTLQAVKDAASQLSETQGILKRAENKGNMGKLQNFAAYSITGLRGELKARSKAQVAGHYGIPGALSNAEIQQAVRWLLEKANFTCDEVNVKEQSCNRARAYCNSIISDLVRTQWFSKGKADVRAMNEMMRTRTIPGPVIALAVTAIENSLQEWAKGSHETISFEEQRYQKIYVKHVHNWATFTKNVPNYVTNLQKDMFSIIARAANKVDWVVEEEGDGDFADIDFKELDAAHA